MSRLTLFFATLLFLAACGQSGPLYLPGNPSEIKEPPRPVETTDEEDEEADNKP